MLLGNLSANGSFLQSSTALGGQFHLHQSFIPVSNRKNTLLDSASGLRQKNGDIKHKISIDKDSLTLLNNSTSVVKIRDKELGRTSTLQVSASQYRRQELNRKFDRSGILNNDVNFRGYMHTAKILDVQTGKDSAAFYSGKDALEFMKNRQLARNYARKHGLQTLEEGTVGGRWLNKEAIFGRMSFSQAMNVWGALSQRFAEGARGKATAFVRGTEPDSIYMTKERPALLNNKVDVIEK